MAKENLDRPEIPSQHSEVAGKRMPPGMESRILDTQSLCRAALRALSRYFEVAAGSALTPGVIAAIQTFGDRINFYLHPHFLVTEGGVDEAGAFPRVSVFDDARPAALFAREVLGFLVRHELLSPECAERLLSWRQTGFSVHSGVSGCHCWSLRARTAIGTVGTNPGRRRWIICSSSPA